MQDATDTQVRSNRGRLPNDMTARAAKLAERGIKPLTFAGRPLKTVTVGTVLAVPVKDFEGREKLDKKARTIAGVLARSIDEAADKSDADIAHKREYLLAQVVRLVSDNINL